MMTDSNFKLGATRDYFCPRSINQPDLVNGRHNVRLCESYCMNRGDVKKLFCFMAAATSDCFFFKAGSVVTLGVEIEGQQ